MHAVMDDPARPTLYRVSGDEPFPDPAATPSLAADILPRQVTLRDRQTIATVVPFASRHQVPPSLIVYLCDQLNKEIEGGDTYPMMDPFSPQGFADYWFQNFGAVMLLGEIENADAVAADGDAKDWSKECLGSFFIRPNYPGRSSHVCNAGFIVTDALRNRGAGRLMGEAYIDWAPRLGYTYSVFNLVYETNVASCRIWDALGFKRIGRVKGCGNLKSHPDRLIDAIIYGRDLTPGESEELVSEERFDKIRFYLKYGKYPNGADRAEKSRLRSAATHYKLTDGDKLMLKDKEVISDPARQYDIARNVHVQQHGGINKTTATIAEKYHWSRIKETVSDVIRNCTECKELGKAPNTTNGTRRNGTATTTPTTTTTTTSTTATTAAYNYTNTTTTREFPMPAQDGYHDQQTHGHHLPSTFTATSPTTVPSSVEHHHAVPSFPVSDDTTLLRHHHPMLNDTQGYLEPIDPQIITNNHHHHHHHHHQPTRQQQQQQQQSDDEPLRDQVIGNVDKRSSRRQASTSIK